MTPTKKGVGRPKKSSAIKNISRFRSVSTDEAKKRKKKEGKHSRDFRVYIKRVLKMVDTDGKISKKALFTMNDLIMDIFERFASEASNLLSIQKRKSNRTTMLSSDVEGAVRFLLPGELGEYAKYEGNKAVAAWNAIKEDE